MPTVLRAAEEEAPRVIERQSSRVQLMADSHHVRRSNSSRAMGVPAPGERRRAPERSATMNVSYHGVRKERSSSRKAVSRQKSNDETSNPHEPVKRQDSDDLGAATLHGKSTISRIRGTRDGKPASKGGRRSDKRSAMKRAMSSENVKPPEEYGEQPEVRRGRRRPSKDSEDTGSDDDDSFAGEDDDLSDIAPLKPSSIGKQIQSKEQRRDLLLLLREKKAVQLSDFVDCKDNRRVLHFLLYQHKLGVDLEGLQLKVDKDIAMNEGGRVPRPIPPLYVEAE